MDVPEPQVGIIMGSISDKEIMQKAGEVLDQMGIVYEMTIVSAHRTPERMMEYAKKARSRGIRVIIAGAGGAAHLPGMVASITTLPVIGVPILSTNSLQGWDSLLSIVQMPGGIPVATMAINGSLNAGLMAARIIGSQNEMISKKLEEYKSALEAKVMDSLQDLNKE